ncbi:OLC1v1021052C1 [Oldenlandia corymbosa var. corymbosa]|uniref:OLC1v1021052C1 n=1 Tax=Oldenlandia corymbosa var. corymbosa TaxID=529605 RepID=A0AAV1BWR2_OLDCO|nr:OLC1v1021052C1 [Oldenlandia corymbosa var. corymbosa]
MPSKDFTKPQSTSSVCTTSKQLSISDIPNNWRIQRRETQLISQVSAIILQRQTKYWASLLKTTLKFSSLTPFQFLQILNNTKASPKISLEFYNWARKNLHFEPDLKTQCKLTHLLYGSGLSNLAKPILSSIVQAYPSHQVVSSLCKVANFETCSSVLCAVLKGYCKKGLYLDALRVYLEGKEFRNGVISVDGCNALLHLLANKNESRLAWCVYSSMIRDGVFENQFTWPILGRILCEDGKFERISRILDMGINSSVLFDLLIQNYGERGDFDAAFSHIDKMFDKKLVPTLGIYSSILDGACKCGDTKVIEMVIGIMIEKGFVPKEVSSEYDSVIQKLADLGKTYAAKLFLDRASAENVVLQDATYGCMLRALSNSGRLQDAIEIHLMISERKIVVNDVCYNAFASGLCTQEPSEKVHELLKDLIEKGFHPDVAEVSRYIKVQCENLKWKQAEHFLNYILDKGFVPDSFCCCSLVKYYCSSGQVDLAIKLHNKMKLSQTFDVETYNLLLHKLFKQRRVSDTLDVFEDMKMQKIYNTESFTIMIRELCQVKELREAMKIHDEMLKLGLKPNGKTYKRLISGFA